MGFGINIMKNDNLIKISKILNNPAAKEEKIGCFYAESEFLSDDIDVEVDGIGKLRFPLSNQQIQELIAISTKAKFGLKEKTLLDEKIRNTHEISASKIKVIINELCLEPLLVKLRSGLLLPSEAKLITHLHNLLIYEEGQFFNKHQDSEKLPNMVATLVIVLPSAHIGGDLIINHNQKKHVFSTESINPTTAKSIAFYADCYHEITKVKQGYRLALTYNLVLQSGQTLIPKTSNPALKKAVESFFQNSVAEKEPAQLVYLLDHSYSEHGLKWNLLKGSDSASVSELSNVAKELGLVSHLTLVEIHESWTTNDDYDRDPEPEELIDSDTELSCFIDEANKKTSFSNHYVGKDQICYTKETSAFKPDNSEYEGFMGNYGNTVDYWYKRASLILWRASDSIAMNFLLNYKNALKELQALTQDSGNKEQILEIISKAKEYLHRKNEEDQKEIFITLINVALYLEKQDLAKSILADFKWQVLNPVVADLLVKLQKSYGSDWFIALAEGWKSSKQWQGNEIISDINVLVRNFLDCGGDIKIAKFLLMSQINSLAKQDQQLARQRLTQINKTLPTRIRTITHLLKACAMIADQEASHAINLHLIENQILYPKTSLAKLLLTLTDEEKLRYQTLKTHLLQLMNNKILLGLQSESDWSIQVELPCTCQYCKVATEFLSSKTDRNKIWPIAASFREHIENELNGMDLPLSIKTEKKGSPHKLIITKEPRMHKEAKAKFEELKECYDKLVNASSG